MSAEYAYISIDLKSFYASVECMERGLNPLTTNLVVADQSRTEKTICLAVSPSLKAYGISGRARLFQVAEKIREVNSDRRRLAPGRRLCGESSDDTALRKNPSLAVSYIVAPPRMAYYVEYSTRIYNIYLKYIAPEDMHVYSIDEVMIDASRYLNTYRLTARELAVRIIRDIYHTTGITATAGIGSNLYLSKIAMDILAKKSPPDQYGARIAELDESDYRRLLWTHRPLTDFWRVGQGYARKLEENGLFTMGDIARCSLGSPSDYYNEELLYRLFGINAELLIDHAWGYEPCTMADIKAYRPDTSSIVSGQVLSSPYSAGKARLVVREMADAVALDLVGKGMVTGQLTLTVGYDIENLTAPDIRGQYQGEVTVDRYGRKVPKHAHGTVNLDRQTSSSLLITDAAAELYDRIINPRLLVRRISLSANRIVPASSVTIQETYEQLDLFTDYTALQKAQEEQDRLLEREQKMQKAVLEIKKKFGKNAILKGISLEDGATARERNQQIGGHKA